MVFGHTYRRRHYGKPSRIANALFIIAGLTIFAVILLMPFAIYADYQRAKQQYPNASFWERVNK